MSSNSVRHNDDLNPFIRAYDVKSLQSVLYSVVEVKTEEAYVIVRNSRNYLTLNVDKSCYMLFKRRGDVDGHIGVKIDNLDLNRVDSVKFL